MSIAGFDRFMVFFVASLAILSLPGVSAAEALKPEVKSAATGHGVTLHYVEAGHGPPLVFVHGSLSDYTYWDDQVAPFATRYHVIVYSRRYNFPNKNSPITGYSAVTDAEDLAGLIKALHLGKVFLVGHSYGALTTLFLASRHPELIRAAALAEPPAVSLLQHLPGDEAARGRALFEDIQARMIAPMKAAFASGDDYAGVGDFIDYVFNDPNAWEHMSASSKADTLRDAHEWDVMMTRGTLFPDISPEAIRAIQVPMLLLSGAKSYAFLALTDEDLARLLPHNRHVVFADAGHQMWLKRPEDCRRDVEAFFAGHGGPAL